MKTIALALFVFVSHSLVAQIPNPVFNQDVILINGFNTQVEKGNLMGTMKQATNFFTGFVKDHAEVKLVEKDQVFTAEQIMLSQVTDKRGDLIYYFYHENEKVMMAVAYKMGYDVYLNPTDNPEEYAKFKQYVLFAARKYYANQLPKAIKQLEKDLKSLEKEAKTAKKESAKASKASTSLAAKSAKTLKKAEKLKAKQAKADAEDQEKLKLEVLELTRVAEKLKVESKDQKARAEAKNESFKSILPKIESATFNLKQAQSLLVIIKKELGAEGK